MTHGHELQGGNAGEKGWAGWSRVKGWKKDNYNSTINKYIKKKEVSRGKGVPFPAPLPPEAGLLS